MASFDLQGFVEDVKRASRESDGQRAVEEVLRRAVSELRAVVAGIGEPKEAGIHPVLQSDDITIINVVWPPFMLLLPHEHAMWASIGVYTGREDNILWRRTGPRVAASGATS